MYKYLVFAKIQSVIPHFELDLLFVLGKPALLFYYVFKLKQWLNQHADPAQLSVQHFQ